MMEIRNATNEDLQEIKAVVKSAFYREGKDEVFNEWEFMDKVCGVMRYCDSFYNEKGELL